MKLLLILIVLLLGFSASANADDRLPQRTGDFFSTEDPLEGLPATAAIPGKVIDKYFEQCRSIYPERFSPEAFSYYCRCTAAAIQGSLSVDDYRQISQVKNQNIYNKSYVRYLLRVVHPCLDQPLDDMEYYNCVVNRKNNPAILSIPEYCKCVSATVSQHVRKYGDAEIIITLGNNQYSREPLNALWNSAGYKLISQQARSQCIGEHVKHVPQKKTKKGCE